MFRSILCATDFSPRSAVAVEVAAQWAEAHGATLDLLHVVPPLITRAVPATEVLETPPAPSRRAPERRLDEIVAALRSRGPTTGRVSMGFAATEIVTHAKLLRSDLVVLAAGGENAIARVLLGSVTDRVLRTSETPVLIVPEGARASPPSVIVAPTDLTPASEHAVALALELAVELSAAVEVVHAYEIPSLLSRESTLVRDLALTLREGVRDLHQLGARANLHVMEAPSARAILEVAQATHGDFFYPRPAERSRSSPLGSVR